MDSSSPIPPDQRLLTGIQMAADERRSGLLEVIRRRSFATLPDLAMELGVSESTIRRDLDFFETSGFSLFSMPFSYRKTCFGISFS